MIPVKWPDATLAVLTYLRGVLPSEVFTRTKKNTARQVILDTEWQQLETPVSRRCAVLFETHVKRSNGTADVSAAVDLASTVLFELQRDIPGVVRFDQPIGPRVVTDPEEKFEFAEGSIVLVFSA